MTLQMILDKMDQMIRLGFVNARMPEKMRVKVTLRDTPGGPLVTKWLPVLCPRACGDLAYDLPDVGDQVLCVFLAYGLEQGFVVGSMYGKQDPPVQNADKWHRAFRDGTTLEYDRATHELTAHVKGHASLTATGSVTMKADGPITLEAPTVYVRGTLVNTARDGSPGKSVFSGGMEVLDGGVNVAAGDVVAAGVSLASHTTEGVEPGSGTSSHPSGGSAVSPGTAAMAGAGMSAALTSAALQEKEADVQNRGDERDALIMCLPRIARHKAVQYRKKRDEADTDDDTYLKERYKYLAEAWDTLAPMLEKWIAAPASKVKATEGDEYVWLDFDLFMNFPRFANAYRTFTAVPPIEKKRNIFNKAAQDKLGEILCKHGYMVPGQNRNFDFIQNPEKWREWSTFHHTSYPVPSEKSPVEIEGDTVVLGGFNFYALAKGRVEWQSGNKYKVYVDDMAVIVWDTFNFEKETEVVDKWAHSVFGLGWWNCEPPSFEPNPFSGGTVVRNDDFRNFRDKGFGGTDFMVMTKPRPVENFSPDGYEYVCKNACQE